MKSHQTPHRPKDDGLIVRITCPLCGNRFSLSRAVKHRNKHHEDLSLQDFEAQIADALKSGQLDYKATRTDKRDLTTATAALKERSKLVVTDSPRIVSGGSFGLKK